MTTIQVEGRTIPISHMVTTARKFNRDRLVKVRLYGRLATVAGRELFELAISSVREAITALHYLTGQRTTQYIDRTRQSVRWRVLVNGKQIDGDKPSVADELMIERDMDTIDIYPVMEGAGMNIFGLIIGAILLVVGIIFMAFGGGLMALHGIALMMVEAGAMALLGGLASLLQKPSSTPKDKGNKGNPSYLFSGSVNTQQQGGPVPVAYGKVIIGSQMISAWVTNSDVFGVPLPWSGQPAGVQLPSLPSNPKMAEGRAAAAPATAMTYTWNSMGSQAMWGYFNSVQILPTAYSLPTEQFPHSYPNGPWWVMRQTNGGLVCNYSPSGNNGPWLALNTMPQEVNPILVTQKQDWYIDFAPTPNIP